MVFLHVLGVLDVDMEEFGEKVEDTGDGLGVEKELGGKGIIWSFLSIVEDGFQIVVEFLKKFVKQFSRLFFFFGFIDGFILFINQDENLVR